MTDALNFPITPGALTAAEIRQRVGKDNPVIIEIGANCGQTTVELLRAMPGATIFAFEPDPRAIAKFRTAVVSPNVHLYECAIGSMNGTINFYQSSGAEHLAEYSQGWDQSGSIRPPNSHVKVWPWVKFQNQITVPIMTLDSWSEQHQVTNADFIWADVQGAESDLVEGATRFLKASRYFYTEYSNDEWYQGQATLSELLAKLSDFELVRRYPMDALFENTGMALNEARAKQARTAADKKPVVARRSAVALIDEGNMLEEQGQIREAMARYDFAVQADPQCARAHLNRGNILAAAEYDEARRAYQLAIACDPHYAPAHFNLGNLNYRTGEFELALRNYQAAIVIRPDFADAFVAMANALDNLGRLDEAVENYERALAINPNYAEIHSNLALLATTKGRHEEAAYRLLRALDIEPSSTIKLAFANCVARIRFTSDDPQIRAALTTAIVEAWAASHELVWPALSLIMLEERIARCVRLANESRPLRLPREELFGPDGLAALGTDLMLLELLERVPIRTIEFERFLTCARRALLETASHESSPESSPAAALRFYVALTRQCFINEYIFDCDDSEQIAATECRAKLQALLDAKGALSPFLVLAVAAYQPLTTLSGAIRLLAAHELEPISGVLRQQIR